MITRAYKAIRLITTVAVAFCMSLAVWLAVVAYQGSKEVGAGAAQGDFGFFLILCPATAIIVCVTMLSFWVERRCAKRAEPPVSASSLLLWVSVASLCAVGWDWFFLLTIWRA
jgi:hypothetical protein